MKRKIQFIILTCDKYLKTRVEAIKKSWGKNQDIKFLTDTESDNSEIIGYNTQKNYNGIFEKYFNFFKTYNFNENDYFFFADDDTFVHLLNLEKLDLPSADESFCIGRLLCLNDDGTDLWGNQTGTNVSNIKGENTYLPIYYPSGGSGFIISKTGCKKIQKYLNQTDNIPYCKYSDVSLGFWMRNSSVEFIPNVNFWWNTHDLLLQNTWEKYSSDENIITFHYVNEDLMVQYHNKYNIK